MNQQALEAAAKALCEDGVRGSWKLMGPIRREPWIERARSALTAYAEAVGDTRDAEIERLKAQLEEASQRVNQTCFVCRRSYYDHAFRDEGSGACRQFTTGIEAGLRNTNDDLRAQLSASEEKRKVLANEALRKREQAAASERLQEFDQHASHAEKEGGLRAILLAEWVEARNAHAEAIKATDAAKALEG